MYNIFKEFMDRTQVTLTILLVLLLFGWNAIPFVYSFSFAFNSAPKGYTMIVMYHIITGNNNCTIDRQYL
jgi:hypothetical protein